MIKKKCLKYIISIISGKCRIYAGSAKAKAAIFSLVSLSMVLLCACGANPDAEETMQIQVEDEDTYVTANEDTYVTANEIELDSDTKEELSAQLLKDRDMDTSILKSTRKTKCTFSLPEDFEEAEDMPGMYLNEHYPVDASTIYYMELDKDSALQLMSEYTFKENMESELKQIYDSDIKINIESFENIKIDGFASFRILYSYINDDIKFTQLQYIINADKTYSIIYSQTDDYDRMEEYEASAGTIRVE